MKKRKIDDGLLIEMIRSGKKQTECAAYFGVSNPAISQRLQRILPPVLPASLNKLTEKEQQFCLNISKGKSRIDSAMGAYEITTRDSAKSLACRLLKEPDIQTAISDLMAQHGLSRSYRVQKLRSHVDNKNPDVSLRALDQSWKLDGSYAPEKHQVMSLNMNISDQERAELEAMAKELSQRYIDNIHKQNGDEGDKD